MELYTSHISLLMPMGYRMKKRLYLHTIRSIGKPLQPQLTYLNHARIGGTCPVKKKTKYEYLTTSVALHASNMVE
jgi:hypothetical protein